MPNEQLREENYKKTLDAGLKCFYEYGIENTQLKNVVEKSGISSRSISRYYSLKENFVKLVLEYSIETQQIMFKNKIEQLINSEMIGHKKLIGLLDIMKEMLLSDFDIFVFLADTELYLGRHNTNKSLCESQIKNFCNFTTAINNIFISGIEDNSVIMLKDSHFEAKVLSQSIISFLIQIALGKKISGYSVKQCEEIVDLFLARIAEYYKRKV